MIILVIIVVVMAIVALAVLGVVIYKLNLRIAMLDAESREANAGYIGLMQEREHQIILMQTVDAIAFKLLGMPDNDLEKFDSFLLEGMHEVSIFGELDAIRVYRNEPYGDDMKYVMQLSWEDGFTPDTSETGESYLYSKLPGWFERLDTMEPINTVVSALTEAEQDFIGTQAKSLLVMPVVFQERFWGTVWYEDFHNVEPFDQKRVALLRSAALMIISAVHRKRQVNRIREATRRTRLMLDAMPMCCFVWDSNFNMIEANEMGWKFFGFKDKEELMARFHDTNPLCQLDGERSEETRCKNIQRALEEGTYNFEWMHIIPSTGERVPSEVSLVRMLYDGKHVVAAYVRDVREQTQMMQEIKYRGDLLETVNRAANVLLQSSTEDFESALFRTLSMIARSVRVERIFVWEQKEHDGAQLFQELYEWVGDATMIHKPDRLIEFAGELSSFTVRFARGVNPSGLTRDLPEDVQDTLGLIDTKSYLIIPIFLRPSVIWGLIGFCDLRVERGFSSSDEIVLRSGGLLMANALLRNEMTQDIKSRSIQLRAALSNAEAASQAKSNFLSTMSHEMRTPMNVVLGMTKLGRDADSKERKDYSFDRIEAASSHLLGVINDVLDMSKIEAGMLKLSDEPFGLDKMIENVVALNQFRMDEKKQKFSLFIDPQIPKIIVADKQRLAQVLTNLLSNACKFTPNHLGIRLEAHLKNLAEHECTIHFRVIDEGIGLNKEQQGKLFKSFVQAEDSTTRKFGGTGLGLAISKHIVELMGGTVWVESELGQGATFAFTIQAKKPDKDEIAQLFAVEPTATEEQTFPDRCLLLVDDGEINREIIIAMLEDSELEIVCAENGGEAYALFAEFPEKFDLVFMDVHMPIMDGYQATQKIRALEHPRAKTIPIVAMTANVFREDIENCLNAGMNAHIGKPLDFKAVWNALKKYLQ